MTPIERELAAIRERQTKAQDMVSALCQPRGTEGARSWVMSIPARPDHDPDLVIGTGQRDALRLLAAVEALSAAAQDAAPYLRRLPRDGTHTYEAWQFAVELENALTRVAAILAGKEGV